jgi:hypothetical protein
MLTEEQKQKLNQANKLIKDVASELDTFSGNEILTASQEIESFISIDEKVTEELQAEKL